MNHHRSFTRRAFLAATTTTAAAASTRLNAAQVVPGKRSPNETVRAGLIGLGPRCRAVADSTPGVKDLEIVAACDCIQPRLDSVMQAAGQARVWKPYLDFREMIEKEQLDAVFVETTTHARAWIACHAMMMGADAYIEKPMCLTIAEGRHMVQVARKYERVTQVGTQQRSIPLNNWASDLVKNGAIGKVHTVLAPNFIGPMKWPGKPGEPLPEGMTPEQWDIWTNQAVFRPYHPELRGQWSAYEDYDAGGLSFGVSGWGTHSYDQVQRGLGTSETGPVEIVLEEEVANRGTGEHKEREVAPDETGSPYYHMTKGTVGPRAAVRMRYANGTVLRLVLDGDYGPGLGCIFEGERGRIEINRDMISADPDTLITASDRPAPLDVPETQPHIEDFVNCVKSRARCNADIEYGQRSSAICDLVNIARKLGKVGESLAWDPDAERFTNCPEGNDMLSRPRREGWELPA